MNVNQMPCLLFLRKLRTQASRVKDNRIYDRNGDGPFPFVLLCPLQKHFSKKKQLSKRCIEDSKKTGNMPLQSSDTSVKEKKQRRMNESASEMASIGPYLF
jgi:hypothetical protein